LEVILNNEIFIKKILPWPCGKSVCWRFL